MGAKHVTISYPREAVVTFRQLNTNHEKPWQAIAGTLEIQWYNQERSDQRTLHFSSQISTKEEEMEGRPSGRLGLASMLEEEEAYAME